MNSIIQHQTKSVPDTRAQVIARLFSKGYPDELPLSQASSFFERIVGSPTWRTANGKRLIEIGEAYQDKTYAIVLKAEAAMAIGLLVRDDVSGEIKPGDLFRNDDATVAPHDAFEEIPAGAPFKGKRLVQTAPDGSVREFKLRSGVGIEGINRDLPEHLLLHKTPAVITDFPANARIIFRGISETGTPLREGPYRFWSDTKSEAEKYAGETGTVFEQAVSPQNPFLAENWIDAKIKLGLPLNSEMDRVLDGAKALGHDWVIWRHHGIGEFVELYPAVVPPGPKPAAPAPAKKDNKAVVEAAELLSQAADIEHEVGMQR